METKNVCIIGLGYIGLPTAAILTSRGHRVTGVDINPSVVATINEGKIHIIEPDLESIVKVAVQKQLLRATTEPCAADIFILCVPTPFRENHEPDLTYVLKAVNSIAPLLKKGNLVILESTSPVGTTQQIASEIFKLRPDLRENKDSLSGDIFLAYCPERVLPGFILHELVNNDRIVGGINPQSTEVTRSFYKTFVKGKIHVTESRTAEMAKLTENAYRDVNIAFANELANLCQKLQIDSQELITLANYHPRVKILNPGPGVGGHCIAVDPWFIVASCPEEAKLIKIARQVNDGRPAKVITKILDLLKSSQHKVAIFGLSYKADIDDIRESPAMEIITHFAHEFDGPIMVVEPNLPDLPSCLASLEHLSLCSLEHALNEATLLIFLVDHRDFKYIDATKLEGKTILDTRGFIPLSTAWQLHRI